MVLLIALAGVLPGCNIVIPIQQMPGWADVETLRQSRIATYRHVALDMRATATEELRHTAEQVFVVEAPSTAPAALTVYIHCDHGPEVAVPVLQVKIGDREVEVLPAEYVLGPGPFPIGVGPFSDPVTLADWEGTAMFRTPQFRYWVSIDEPAPVEIRVRTLSQDETER